MDLAKNTINILLASSTNDCDTPLIWREQFLKIYFFSDGC